MIIGSHLQNILEFNHISEEFAIGFNRFPANSKVKNLQYFKKS